MNSSLFIAKKIITASNSSKNNSQTIIKIATYGTILSTVIMILTIFISYGFKENIIDKVRGFSSDYQIINFDANQSFDYQAISINQKQKNKITEIQAVKSISGFITKPAILKFEGNIEGIVLKGYSETENYDFFKKHIIEGEFPDFTNKEILISEDLAKQLQLKIADKVLLYFIQEPVRYRKLKISGIYKTDIYEFDHLFAVVDINILQKLNGWEDNIVSGYEINTFSKPKSDIIQKQIDKIIRPQYFSDDNAQILKSLSTKERFQEFYFWFDLFDTNVIVIISLMVAVAIINLISALLIVILENTNKVGLLKAFGADNKTIRNIFIYFSAYLTIKGLFWGNVIALIIGFIQKEFHIIPLDAVHYFISYVPISFDWTSLIILDLATVSLITITLLIPSNYISKISPIKVIRFN